LLDLWRSHCLEMGIDGVIVLLDAKKAFDSVDHHYLVEALRGYGFSNEFISIIKMLYNNLESNVMVNGFTTEYFRLDQCVKQGDALSCGLFIICIDPLIRKINNNLNIKSITFTSPFTNYKTQNKTQGFADDISVVTLNDKKSIEAIFEVYESFSYKSGIFLNADKTEILSIIGKKCLKIDVTYCGETYSIESVSSLTICGRLFSNIVELEIKHNIELKIIKLEKQLQIWSQRDLSFEGKIIIVKTFGISQILYSMQNQFFDDKYINEIERIIYGFIWSKRDLNILKGKFLKNHIVKVGLKVSMLDALTLALKQNSFWNALKNPIIIYLLLLIILLIRQGIR